MSDPIQVYFYGGVIDGLKSSFTKGIDSYDHPHAKGDRGKYTRYVRNDEWSQHFGKLIFVPQDFPGRPPKRELQTA
jgi:hypothetical protein